MSAHSLQAFVDCPRRFQLQYLERMAWPAVPVDPLLQYEEHMANGRRFHQMVQQDLLGATVLVPASGEPHDIHTWWNHYMRERPGDVPGRRFVEHMLVGAVGDKGTPLVAMYDLIVLNEGEARIFDWKTARHRPPRAVLEERLQTRVYLYLLAMESARLTGGDPLPPESLQMIYWFAGHPENPEIIRYDEARFRRDEHYLRELLGYIEAGLATSHFALTEDHSACRFCRYRSFCGRGGVAGRMDETEIDDEEVVTLDLLGDLDAIEAIAF